MFRRYVERLLRKLSNSNNDIECERIKKQVNATLRNEIEVEFIRIHRVERKIDTIRSVIPYRYKTNEYLNALLTTIVDVVDNESARKNIFIHVYCAAAADGMRAVEDIAAELAREYPVNAKTALEYINEMIDARSSGKKIYLPTGCIDAWNDYPLAAYYLIQPVVLLVPERNILKDIADDLTAVGLL